MAKIQVEVKESIKGGYNAEVITEGSYNEIMMGIATVILNVNKATKGIFGIKEIMEDILDNLYDSDGNLIEEANEN